jgi:hypothetical protein
MRLLKLFVLLATVAGGAAAAAPAEDGWGPAAPNFNLEVVLRPTATGPESGFGLVKFRQPNDNSKIILLDTWVRGLAPNHTYRLERAVDLSAPNGACASESGWASLGTIPTDDRGMGRAPLSRDLTMTPIREFDIHFHVVDVATGVVVLESSCYQFTVAAD